MNCKTLVDKLVDYLDGELEERAVRRLESHLDNCPGCVKFVETYRQTGSICRKALRVTMPGRLGSSLKQFLRSELKTPSP